MIGTQESKLLLALLASEERLLGEVVAEFDARFPRESRFRVLCALATILEDKMMLKTSRRLIAFTLLQQAYDAQRPSPNPFISVLVGGSYEKYCNNVFKEVKGCWCDLLMTVIIEEWKHCKKEIEVSYPQKDLKNAIMAHQPICLNDDESSAAAGERMCETVKVFVLHHQLRILSCGGVLPDQPHVGSPKSLTIENRATRSGLDVVVPNPGTEINLGILGWVILAEELPVKPKYGIVHVAAPLAGSNPRIDDKHSKWLHLRIRPSRLPSKDRPKSESFGRSKPKSLIDGRWTLAFVDEQSCKNAEAMILEEMDLQRKEVEMRLMPLLNLDSSSSKDAANLT